MATLRKIRDIDIYRDETWYCGPGPSVVVYPDDEIVVAFRRSRAGGHGSPAVEACIVRSTDEGDTWSEPEVFDSGPIRNQNLTLLSDGTLLVAMPSSDLVTREVYEELKANTPPGSDDEVREYPGGSGPSPRTRTPATSPSVGPTSAAPPTVAAPGASATTSSRCRAGTPSCRASRPPSG